MHTWWAEGFSFKNIKILPNVWMVVYAANWSKSITSISDKQYQFLWNSWNKSHWDLLRKGVNEKMGEKSIKWPWIWNRVKGPQLVEIKNVDINNRKSRVHVGVVTYIVIYGVFNIITITFNSSHPQQKCCLLLVVGVIFINTIMIMAWLDTTVCIFRARPL